MISYLETDFSRTSLLKMHTAAIYERNKYNNENNVFKFENIVYG